MLNYHLSQKVKLIGKCIFKEKVHILISNYHPIIYVPSQTTNYVNVPPKLPRKCLLGRIPFYQPSRRLRASMTTSAQEELSWSIHGSTPTSLGLEYLERTRRIRTSKNKVIQEKHDTWQPYWFSRLDCLGIEAGLSCTNSGTNISESVRQPLQYGSYKHVHWVSTPKYSG